MKTNNIPERSAITSLADHFRNCRVPGPTHRQAGGRQDGFREAMNRCAAELERHAKLFSPPSLTDAEIAAWVERHDLGHALTGKDARSAFEDAQTAHLLNEGLS